MNHAIRTAAPYLVMLAAIFCSSPLVADDFRALNVGPGRWSIGTRLQAPPQTAAAGREHASWHRAAFHARDDAHRIRPIAEVPFRESDTLAQFGRYRSLSLLTLGTFGQKRLFLGINARGLFGLHFNSFPQYGDERYLELARMPYLEEAASDER